MNNATFANSPVPAIGRLLLAAIFLASGFGKIADPAGTIGYITAMGLPLPMLAYAGAVAVEVGGGLMLVLGFHTRLAALALAAFSVVTGLAFHNAVGDQNQMIHLMKNFAMAGGLLQVVAFGAGAFSVDNRKSVTPRVSVA